MLVDDCFEVEARGGRTRWVILSRGERQAKEAIDEGVKKHAKAYNMAVKEIEGEFKVSGKESYTMLDVVLPGGSKITALPANPDTNVARPSVHHNLVQGVWVLDVAAELVDAKANRIQALSSACEADIYTGFTSSALGSPHHYPAKDKDQQNLTASVLDSTVPGLPTGWQTPFWCESGGVWDFRMHTAEQIQQVGRDGKARILTCLTLNKSLSDQVLGAATKAEVESIAWVSPA